MVVIINRGSSQISPLGLAANAILDVEEDIGAILDNVLRVHYVTCSRSHANVQYVLAWLGSVRFG